MPKIKFTTIIKNCFQRMKISRGSSYKVALRFQGLHAIYHKCWSYFHTCTHFVLLRQTADSSFKYIYRPHNSSTWNNSLGSNNNKSDTEIYFKTVEKQKKHTDKQNQLIQTLFCTEITRMNQIFFFGISPCLQGNLPASEKPIAKCSTGDYAWSQYYHYI